MRKSGMAAVLLLVLAAACKHGGGDYGSGGDHGSGKEPKPPGVNLEPNDPRPIYCVQVGDDIEAALLQERLGVEPLQMVGNSLCFHETAGVRDRLREYGYVPNRADPYDVYERVVRVTGCGDDAQLRRSGVRLINRERDYRVISGKLGVLRSLARSGCTLAPIASNEPFPRAIRVIVRTPQQAQEVGHRVSVYASGYSGRPGDEFPPMVLAATAFDDQIEQLIADGFVVERMEPPQEGRP